VTVWSISARVDVGRHDELAAAVRGRHNQSRALLQLMIDRGVATGEIDPSDREVAGAFLRTVFAGLVDAASSRRIEQRRAMDGLMALVEGGLVRRPRRRSRRAG
jgi:hypothetical protein